MKNFYSNRVRCMALLVAGIFCLAGLAAQDAELNWYARGEGKLVLDAVPGVVQDSFTLSGKTTQKTMMVQFKKDSGGERRLMLPLAADGSFKVIWLFKDGPGKYTINFFGSPQAGALSYAGIAYIQMEAKTAFDPSSPALEINDKVLAYVQSVMGTQVDRGECWDLAQEALDRNLADWVRPLQYGIQLDPRKDEIRPGDIIQFKTVTITEKLDNGGTRWETLGAPDHTAVIWQVYGPLKFQLAHQNLGGKRFVQLTDLDLNKMTSGQFWIWRPRAGALYP